MENENIKRALNEIVFIIKERKTFNKKISSYGLKHVLEKYRKKIIGYGNYYISNGDFILAMEMMGYKINFIKDSPNCFFNCSLLDF